MSVTNFGELSAHIGHRIVCVGYGGEPGCCQNLALECETCGVVLVDFNAGGAASPVNISQEPEAESDELLYRTVYTFEALSQGPMPDAASLSELAYLTTEGGVSGAFIDETQEVVDGPAMVKLLRAQHSDPEFLGLKPDGTLMERSNAAE